MKKIFLILILFLSIPLYAYRYSGHETYVRMKDGEEIVFRHTRCTKMCWWPASPSWRLEVCKDWVGYSGMPDFTQEERDFMNRHHFEYYEKHSAYTDLNTVDFYEQRTVTYKTIK